MKELHASQVKEAPEGDEVHAFVASWPLDELPPLPAPVVPVLPPPPVPPAHPAAAANATPPTNYQMQTPTRDRTQIALWETLGVQGQWNNWHGDGHAHMHTGTPSTVAVHIGSPPAFIDTSKADRSGSNRVPPVEAPVTETDDGKKWYKCPAVLEIARPKSDRQWYFKNRLGKRVFPGSHSSRNMTKLDMWLLSVGNEQMKATLELTNARLDAKGKK